MHCSFGSIDALESETLEKVGPVGEAEDTRYAVGPCFLEHGADADQALLDIDQHENIELKVFNPYKRRSSDAALRQGLNAGELLDLEIAEAVEVSE